MNFGENQVMVLFRRSMFPLAIILLIAGCTAVNTVNLAGRVGENRDIVVTTGGVDQPYRSIGIIQITRTGSWLLGFIPLLPADLDNAFRETLADEATHYGADAVINVNFYELQYPLLLKIVLVFSVISLQYVVVTGEMVEFVDK